MDPFFIASPPKTGSTIITRLIVQHPAVTSLSESYILEPFDTRSIAHPESSKGSQHGFSKEDAMDWQHRFRSKPQAQALAEVLGAAWEKMMKASGATVAGDSWNFYAGHLPVVKEAFPKAKFIYPTRDPRAVYWSGETFRGRRQGGWNSRLLLELDRKARAFFESHDVYVLKYEELMHHPERVLRDVWSYLGVDPELGYIDYDPKKDLWPARWEWVPSSTKPIDASRVDRWMKEMPADKKRIIDLAAAEYASVWGYPLELADGYSNSEFVEAFMAGASLQLLPPEVEELARVALCTARREQARQAA